MFWAQQEKYGHGLLCSVNKSAEKLSWRKVRLTGFMANKFRMKTEIDWAYLYILPNNLLKDGDDSGDDKSGYDQGQWWHVKKNLKKCRILLGIVIELPFIYSCVERVEKLVLKGYWRKHVGTWGLEKQKKKRRKGKKENQCWAGIAW